VQGRRVLREGARLSDVLEEALPALQADLEKVQVLRGTAPLVINYKKYRNGLEDSDTVNPPLEDGDRIYIRLGEPTEGTVKIVGEVKDITKPTVSIGAASTVSQVIGVVGGPTEYGNRKGIFIQRGSQRIDVPYEEIVGGATDKDVKLLDKDEVHIPRLEKPRQYTVFGGVQTRGAFPLQGKVTVLQAVANAGPMEGAKWKKEVRLSRPDKAGNYPKEARKINMEKGNEAAMEILDGDVLYVPEPSRKSGFDIGQAVGVFGNLVWISSLLRR
jgi:protein involved in polysaccharide export with SLBB domain